jgi:hypothetical protein
MMDLGLWAEDSAMQVRSTTLGEVAGNSETAEHAFGKKHSS